MKNPQFFFLAIVVCLSGCARVYLPVKIDALNFVKGGSLDSIDFKFSYNVLSQSENKKYAKKEMKKGYNLLALEISNNSSSSIKLNQDIFLYKGDKLISPLPISIAGKKIRQLAPTYLLYSLIVFSYSTGSLSSSPNGVSVNVTTRYIPIGLPIALGNYLVALVANNQFRKDLNSYDFLDKSIPSHQTLKGFILIEEKEQTPLRIGNNSK